MKIMLVCRVYPWHRPGGMPFVTQDRAHALAKLGHEVVVFTTPFELIPNYTHAHCDGKIYESSDGDVSMCWQQIGVPSQRWSEEFAEACHNFASFFKPDIIHSDSFDNSHPWMVEWTPRVKTAITLHGFTAGGFLTETTRYRLGLTEDPPMFDSVGNLREARSLAKVGRVITVSRHEQRLAELFYGVIATTVFNPIPDYFFTPVQPIPENAYALCAGVPGTSGNRRFDLAERVCRELGLPLRVAMNASRQDMPSLYDGCLCYLLPTLWHTGFDLTVAEANARGRLVIASHVGSYAEHERDDFLETFPVGDVERFKAMVSHQMDARRSWQETGTFSAAAMSKHEPAFHAANWLRAVQMAGGA